MRFLTVESPDYIRAPRSSAIAIGLADSQLYRRTPLGGRFLPWRFGTWSVRKDVPPPSALKPIFDYSLADDFLSFIIDESAVHDERKSLEFYVDKPQGQPVIK
jgi:hypothetical protein